MCNLGDSWDPISVTTSNRFRLPQNPPKPRFYPHDFSINPLCSAVRPLREGFPHRTLTEAGPSILTISSCLQSLSALNKAKRDLMRSSTWMGVGEVGFDDFFIFAAAFGQ